MEVSYAKPGAILGRPMTEGHLQLLRTAGLAGAATVALLLQRLSPHARLGGSWRVNGGLWLVNAAVIGMVCGVCAFRVARWAADAGIGVLNATDFGPWVGLPAAVVALDLVSYGWHRANHAFPFLWRLHQVHHSDPRFTASTGVRFHPGELLLSLPVRLTAVAVIGASVEAVLVFETVFTLANLVEHGDIALPSRLEATLGRACITPALHRRHHIKATPDRNRNFGTIFSVWDRLLGTYEANDSATAIETGLPGLDRVGLLRALVLPLQRPAA